MDKFKQNSSNSEAQELCLGGVLAIPTWPGTAMEFAKYSVESDNSSSSIKVKAADSENYWQFMKRMKI